MLLVEDANIKDEGAEECVNYNVTVDETFEFGEGGQEEEPAQRHNEQ